MRLYTINGFGKSLILHLYFWVFTLLTSNWYICV